MLNKKSVLAWVEKLLDDMDKDELGGVVLFTERADGVLTRQAEGAFRNLYMVAAFLHQTHDEFIAAAAHGLPKIPFEHTQEKDDDD